MVKCIEDMVHVFLVDARSGIFTAIRTPDGVSEDFICSTRSRSVRVLIASTAFTIKFRDQLQLDSSPMMSGRSLSSSVRTEIRSLQIRRVRRRTSPISSLTLRGARRSSRFLKSQRRRDNIAGTVSVILRFLFKAPRASSKFGGVRASQRKPALPFSNT